MALRYYDDIVAAKIKWWMPDNRELRVLKPDETKRLFETQADDAKDKHLRLPLIALSRNPDIELLLNIKNQKSFNGLKISQTSEQTKQLNIIPVKLQYQMDIYAKTFESCEDYVREYLFKLINNPTLYIEVPYNGTLFKHIAYIRVLPNISDTSNISERLFSGQFTRWTIQFEIQDAFLFSIPYKSNWRLYVDDLNEYVVDPKTKEIIEQNKLSLEIADDLTTDTDVEVEPMDVVIMK